MTAMKKSLKATLIAGAIATLPFGSHAAGLGAINVLSGLGQPLRAEIELSATQQELQTLSARIASVEAFRRANVTYSPVMSAVQVSVETRGNRSVVRLISDRPVDEPFLEVLVELSWATGRMLREYTFLLDPIEAVRPTAAVVQPPSAAPAAAPTVAARPAAPAGDYRVQRGDTLRGIANRHRPEGVTLEQMLIALLRENPAAFDDGNINRLRAGAILSIPDRNSALVLDPAQARREVVAQAADFEAYRSRLAGTVAARPAAPAPEVGREAVGEIVPRVDDAPRAEQPVDRVEVSGAPTDGEPTRLARLEALEEELTARERALEEAHARLSELEQSILDMQRLIELRNQSLAQMQQQLAASGVEVPAVTQETPAAPAEELPAPPPVLEAPTEEAAEPAEPVVAEAPAEVPAERPAVAPEPAPAPPVRAEPAPQPEPRPTPRPAPVAPTPAPEPTFLDALLEDPKLLAGGGGILALLLAYAGFKMRQRRKAGESEEPSGLTEFPSEAQSVFGGKGGQSVDTGSSSVLHTDFSQSGLSAIDADEGVDPVAEADVYMAYGRDAQAEEILLDALKADASRGAIYLKLLEIYAQRQSLRQFESVATDLYSRTGGEGGDWAKAAEMGRKLDPENPLYALKKGPGEDEVLAPQTEPGKGGMAGGSAGVAALGAAAAAGVAAGSASSDGEPSAEETAPPSQLGDLDFTTSVPVVEPSPSQLKDTWTMPGDLGRLSQAMEDGSDADVAEAVDAAAVPSEEPSAEDLSVLDFDLGGDEAAETTEATEDRSAIGKLEADRVPEAGDNDLVLDLDIGEESGERSADSVVPELPGVATESDVMADLMSPRHDRSMDATMLGDEFDLAMAEKGLDASGGDRDVDEAADHGIVTVSSGEEIDLTSTQVQMDEPASEDDASVVDLEQTGFDNSLLDFDFDIESATSDPAGEAPPLDLSNIDLNLEPPEPAGAVEPLAESPAGEPQEDVVIPSPDVQQEVDTKLDLARAYEEMGDKEGARELIEEVLREGSTAQREAANRLLERLG